MPSWNDAAWTNQDEVDPDNDMAWQCLILMMLELNTSRCLTATANVMMTVYRCDEINSTGGGANTAMPDILIQQNNR